MRSMEETEKVEEGLEADRMSPKTTQSAVKQAYPQALDRGPSSRSHLLTNCGLITFCRNLQGRSNYWVRM